VRPVLGVDGGGSKTHALVADERGELLGFASSGRSNWEDIGLAAAEAALAGAIGGALLDMGVHAIDTTRYLLGDPLPERV